MPRGREANMKDTATTTPGNDAKAWRATNREHASRLAARCLRRESHAVERLHKRAATLQHTPCSLVTQRSASTAGVQLEAPHHAPRRLPRCLPRCLLRCPVRCRVRCLARCPQPPCLGCLSRCVASARCPCRRPSGRRCCARSCSACARRTNAPRRGTPSCSPSCKRAGRSIAHRLAD